MKKLTQSDRYAIEFLMSKNKTPEDIAKDLGLSLTQVKKIVSNLSSTTPPEKTAESKKDKTKDLIIRQTSAKKNNSVAIMTHGAAQLGDEFIKNFTPNAAKTEGYIYKRSE